MIDISQEIHVEITSHKLPRLELTESKPSAFFEAKPKIAADLSSGLL
jgi:hypothetical protein